MFDAYVTFQAHFKPRAVALITPERWATYAELEGDVNRLAASLRSLGVTPQRGVTSLRIDDPYLKHVAILALARLGVVSSPAEDPEPDLRLVDAEAAAGRGELALTPDWITAMFAAEPTPVPPVRGPPEAIVRVMLSSGTTKGPRRIAKSWAALEANTRTAALTYLAGKGGRWVSMTGLDSGLGQAMALAAWSIGAALVTGFGLQETADELDTLQPSLVGVTPVHLHRLLRCLPVGVSARPDLRLAITGAICAPAIAREARLRLSSDLRISYGAAESGSAAMADGALLEKVPGAAGYPVPGVRIDIVDADGAPVAAGEQGEVRIISERVADGYIGDPEATARAFRHGGLYPGDLGRLLPDGLLVIDGRTDDRMTFGGATVMPNLLEDIAFGCAGVVDAACFAAPASDGTDECWLAVVAGDSFDPAELAGRLKPGPHPWPAVRVAWIRQIPRNANGKIDRRRLREEAMAGMGTPR